MSYLDNILFLIILSLGFGYFALNVKKIVRNIKLGQQVNRTDNSSERWKNMTMIALRTVKNGETSNCRIFAYYSLCWFHNYQLRTIGNCY
jgi:hypothetical protein